MVRLIERRYVVLDGWVLFARMWFSSLLTPSAEYPRTWDHLVSKGAAEAGCYDLSRGPRAFHFNLGKASREALSGRLDHIYYRECVDSYH